MDLTICEPALGSGAFANEAINQLSAIYLDRRSAELGESLDPERYRLELQKVNAHFALHQTYGVDLNSTAVELAEVSLWLNAMYPGLKAPWFGLQLRQGNSLMVVAALLGRSTSCEEALEGNQRAKVVPPTDRPSTRRSPLTKFIISSCPVMAGLRLLATKGKSSERGQALKDWHTAVLKAPSANGAKRLTQLAAAVEELWKLATAVSKTQRQLRRPIDVYGTEPATGKPPPAETTPTAPSSTPTRHLGGSEP